MPQNLRQQFSSHWQSSTADNDLTLHGFRRFKTTHLLNLRFLEAEIADIDHVVFQAGLNLDIPPSGTDRLGLRQGKRDESVPEFDEVVTRDLILRLRDLVQKYDEALIAFNNIISMDTFSLLDDEKQSVERDDLTLYEKYQTRLLRVDRDPRGRQDLFQRWLHCLVRHFRYRKLLEKHQGDQEGPESRMNHCWSYQNTNVIVNIFGRLVMILIMANFLMGPLVILTEYYSRPTQFAVISVCVWLFSFVVTTLLNASNLEMMIVTAAYAAILCVFVSNASTESSTGK